ncbi:MAG: beta-galactosidase, partial [Clostridia bacterium]|nr:beta-galactosidase [Clostridia bacterium]
MERIIKRLHDGFKFIKLPIKEIEKNFSSPELDDSAWESVTVPHDWAIGHDFKKEYDITYRNITADGITKPIEQSGRTGGLPTVGIGWYRLPLDIPAESKGKILELIFDGVMWECEVYVNGKLVGKNHFGYLSFTVDISDAVNYGGENLLAVKAVLKYDCSRWYPGAGIYRNLYLVEKARNSVKYCGIKTQIDTAADGSSADIELTVDTCGNPDSFKFEIVDRDGNTALSGEGIKVCNVKLDRPHLWTLEEPYLYTLKVSAIKNGEVTDSDTVRIGFRNCKFTPDKGFFLNGKPTKIYGICMHHDMGIFGAAINYSVLHRQIEIMHEMGVNSIRTSHNPPAPELLDICDEMGILVMDELFDEWKLPKIENGYAQYFEKHSESDAVAIIRRDINHPSVFIWSIGNEVEEQKYSDGAQVAQRLTDICHREDRTRPTTSGFNFYPQAEENGLYDPVDRVGRNYKPH